MTKRTRKQKQKQIIADAGDFTTVVLGKSEPGIGVQAALFEEHPWLYQKGLYRNYYQNRRGCTTGRIIYFVQEQSEKRLIKIGLTNNLANRMVNLQTDNAHGIEVLGIIDGDAEVERELHMRFSEYHFRGEWFYPAPELLTFIEAHHIGSELVISRPL